MYWLLVVTIILEKTSIIVGRIYKVVQFNDNLNLYHIFYVKLGKHIIIASLI